MDLFYVYLAKVLITSILFGIFAQMSQFCLLGGIKEYFQKQDLGRLLVYFSAIAVALIGVNLMEFFELVSLDNTSPAYRSENLNYGRNILGGFVFGFGMVLAGGCGMRHLVRFGQGSFNSMAIITIYAGIVYLMINTSLYADIFMPIVSPFVYQLSGTSQDFVSLFTNNVEIKSISRLVVGLLMAGIILLFALQNKLVRQPRYLFGYIGVGLAIVIGFHITGGEQGVLLQEEAEFMDDLPRGLAVQTFSFAAPMADVIYALFYDEGPSMITFGVVAVMGLPLGALLGSLLRKEFKFTGIARGKGFFVNLVGAALMGIGSVLAMGCSIGHGLAGISVLGSGSFIALLFIFCGAFIGLKAAAKLN